MLIYAGLIVAFPYGILSDRYDPAVFSTFSFQLILRRHDPRAAPPDDIRHALSLEKKAKFVFLSVLDASLCSFFAC
jgi:hypothetical protein